MYPPFQLFEIFDNDGEPWLLKRNFSLYYTDSLRSYFMTWGNNKRF